MTSGGCQRRPSCRAPALALPWKPQVDCHLSLLLKIFIHYTYHTPTKNKKGERHAESLHPIRVQSRATLRCSASHPVQFFSTILDFFQLKSGSMSQYDCFIPTKIEWFCSTRNVFLLCCCVMNWWNIILLSVWLVVFITHTKSELSPNQDFQSIQSSSLLCSCG